MASTSRRPKIKRQLSHNYYTGKAISTLASEYVQDLFNSTSPFCYSNFEEQYLQRRFHGAGKPSICPLLTTSNRPLPTPHHRIYGYEQKEELLPTDSEHDSMLKQERFEDFARTHNGEKPLLILDVDNTLLFARFFSEEMKINDPVTYFQDGDETKPNAIVTKLRLNLMLSVIDERLIMKMGSESAEITVWVGNNTSLKEYRKGGRYTYTLEQCSEEIECRILKREITGCIIEVEEVVISANEEGEDEMRENNDYDSSSRESTPSVGSNQTRVSYGSMSSDFEYSITDSIEISFVEPNEHLDRLQPCFNRPDLVPVSLIYEGFLVRLRSDLVEFLEYASEDFDVVIYTAACKDVYQGLLEKLHQFVSEQLGRTEDDDSRLWSDVLFRDDCVLMNTERRAKPYHHKDLTLFGCDLSRTVMIDNSPHVVAGQEPNVLLIRDFFGKEEVEEELVDGIYAFLDTIKDIEGDIRYFLCDIDDPADNETVDLSTEETCRAIHERFMNALREKMGIIKSSTSKEIVETFAFSSSDSDEEEDDVPPLMRAQTAQAWRAKRQLRRAQSSANLLSLLLNQNSAPNPSHEQWKGRARTMMDSSDIGASSLKLSPLIRLERYRSMSTLRLDLENFDISPDSCEPSEELILDVIAQECHDSNIREFDFANLDLEQFKLDQIVDIDITDNEEEFSD